MRKKRFLAVALTASMTMASVVTATAAPSVATGSKNMGTVETVTGHGQSEGIVDTNIFNVVVPTTVSESSIFDYILDPQELISATDAARYVKGSTVDGVAVSINSGNFTPSSLYFVNDITVSGATKLSDTSDPYKLINKSTMDVDVSVNAVLTGAAGVGITTDDKFSDVESTNMYMAVKSGSTVKPISTANAADYLLTATMTNAKDKYEKILLSDNATYNYEIPSQNAAGDPISDNDFIGTYEFQLTGSCNTAADWSNFKSGGLTAPDVVVTYYLTPHVDKKPSMAADYRIQAGQALVMDVNLGTGTLAATGISSITYTNSSGAATTLDPNNYTFANNNGKATLTFKESYVGSLNTALDAGASRPYTIEFNDSAKTKVVVTVRK